ncbi:MAG: hypothetical protein OEY56_10375, partial [Cyclobacteriaceae bacterium]|nr:hypothetical protein [Cyclobacteriaceae bacterium]
IGLEHDNVGKTKSNSAKRVIGQLNLTWLATEKLQLNSTYSNFRNISEFNPYAGMPTANPYDNIDSLRFAQISRNASINTMYNSQSETLGQSLMVMFGTMQTDAELGGEVQDTGADYYNANLSYNLNFIPKHVSATLSCNVNTMIGADLKNTMIGPTAGINSLLFNTLNSGLMYTWNTALGNTSGNIQRLQYMASYVLKEKHNINFSAAWTNKDIQSSGLQKNKKNDYLARLGYSYGF